MRHLVKLLISGDVKLGGPGAQLQLFLEDPELEVRPWREKETVIHERGPVLSV